MGTCCVTVRAQAVPVRLSALGARTWNGGSHGRFCMTGRLKAAGACTMSKVTATSTGCEPGSGAATSKRPVKAAVSGEPGRRA